MQMQFPSSASYLYSGAASNITSQCAVFPKKIRRVLMVSTLLVGAFALTTLIFSAYKVNETLVFEYAGTRALYFWTRDINEDIIPDSATKITYKGKTCHVVQVNGVYRHAAEHGVSFFADRVLEKVVPRLRNSQYSFIRKWKNPFLVANDDTVSRIGETEHFRIGVRFAKRYSTFLKHNLENLHYVTSPEQRTLASVKAFHKGLRFTIDVDDKKKPTIEFGDVNPKCVKYTNLTLNDMVLRSAREKHFKGPEIANSSESVNKRIAGGIYNLNTKLVRDIVNICREELININKSDWCQFVSAEDLELWGYHASIDKGFEGHNTYEKSHNLTCSLFSDVFNNMDRTIFRYKHKKRYGGVTIRVSHSSNLAAMFLILQSSGKYTDHFRETYMKNGRWNVGKFLPFSANFVFTLYKCDSDIDTPEFVIKTTLNEDDIVQPVCGKSVCPYNDVKKAFSSYFEKRT